jgi:MATE family multidrug resistance protein
VYRLKPFKSYNVLGRFHPVSVPALKEQLKIGLPVGFAIFFETSIFGVVALFMAQYGTVTIAAHQAAISFASLVYMVPLSIGLALTIIVGFEIGARRYHDAQQYSKLGIGIAVLMAIGCAIGLFIFNKSVAGLYTKEPDVRMLIQQFLIYAAFFQLSDAIAAPIQGILRGYKDVNVTFVVALISYWIIGLPLGFLLAKYSWLGAFGYWVGLITGLAIGAIALTARLVRVQKKMIQTSQGG